MPLKALGLACAAVVLLSPLASAQVDFDALFQTIAFDGEPSSADAQEALPAGPSLELPADEIALPPPPDVIDSLDAAEPFRAAVPSRVDLKELSSWSSPPSGGSIPVNAAASSAAPAGIESDTASRAEKPRQRTVFESLLPSRHAVPTRLESPPAELPPSVLDSPPAESETSLSAPAEPLAERVPSPAPVRIPAPDPVACDSPPHPPARFTPARLASTGVPVTHSHVTPCLDRPNLPPPASLESIYRTPACYRDVWSGYAQERQHHCQCQHKHLHGHCECLRRAALPRRSH